ncbi:DUF6255 family natural product biosynthesis protein [Streptomyces netropsis]
MSNTDRHLQSRITVSVYELASDGRRTTLRPQHDLSGQPLPVLGSPVSYPPCECPRHRGQVRAQPPADNNAAAQRTRCPQCQEIKQKHYAAAHQGNTQVAEAMATAMGRHQRAAHSQQREPANTGCLHPAGRWTTQDGMTTCGGCGTQRCVDYRALGLGTHLPDAMSASDHPSGNTEDPS